MKFRPHGYQRYAIEFIKDHPVTALFLDMGLGKTSITLTALEYLIRDSFDSRCVLIVAPLRVARDTWIEELGKWDHLKGLRMSVVVGSEKERLEALRRKADIYVVNRENVVWLHDQKRKPEFDTLVVDELSSFKNHETKRFRALMKMRPMFDRVIGLTGTPAPNGLMDLFAEYRLLDMGTRLGKFISSYRLNYFTPDKTNGMVVYSYRPRPGAEEAIYRRISDITVSMRSVDHLDMPDLVNVTTTVRMSEQEKASYDRLRKDLVLDLPDGQVTAASAGSLAMKLCQMANGAIYADGGGMMDIHSRKLDALEDLIEAQNGKPVLVAYWFRHDLERIRGRLDTLGVEYGEIRTSDSIRKWNAGCLPVGLLHPASAGHGLNLQSGGSTMIWFGLTWSLELYQQTVGRLWRQGQKSRTVVMQHIATEGTMDSMVMRMLERKSATQDSLIAAVKAEVLR